VTFSNSVRGGVRRASAVLSVTATVAASLVVGAGEAVAWIPSCGSSQFVEQIEVSRNSTGDFIIHVHPTDAARWDSALALDPRGAVVEQWHAVQACVPDLYGDLADRIWQQLDCHQRLAWAVDPRTGDWATGPTYDLESWRPKLDPAWFPSEVLSKCGGYLGMDPAAPVLNPIRPDAGVTDLEHAYDAYA